MGRRARLALREGAAGRVLGASTHAAWCDLEGELLWCDARPEALGPHGVLVPRGWSEPEGGALRVLDGALCGQHALSLDAPTETTRARRHRGGERAQGAAWVWAALEVDARRGPFAEALGEGEQRLARAAWGSAEWAEAAYTLAGLGPGLTPSGDDLLGGALLARFAAGDGALEVSALEKLCARTHRVSAARLRAHAEGEGTRAEVALVDAALEGREGALREALRALEGLGHASGGEFARGVALGLAPALAASAKK